MIHHLFTLVRLTNKKYICILADYYDVKCSFGLDVYVSEES